MTGHKIDDNIFSFIFFASVMQAGVVGGGEIKIAAVKVSGKVSLL